MAPNPYSHYFKVLLFYTIIYFKNNCCIIRWHLSLNEVNQVIIAWSYCVFNVFPKEAPSVFAQVLPLQHCTT